MPKPGPRTTTRYSADFKATAVRLSQLPGVHVQDVAASLYIHPFMLSRWRKQAREGTIMTQGVDVDPAISAELKELRRVKKAYEQLKVEHDLLKKCMVRPGSARTAVLDEAVCTNVSGLSRVSRFWRLGHDEIRA